MTILHIIIALLPSMVALAIMAEAAYRREKMKNGEVIEIAKNAASVVLLVVAVFAIGVLYIFVNGTLP